jgi:hypothetical protein
MVMLSPFVEVSRIVGMAGETMAELTVESLVMYGR